MCHCLDLKKNQSKKIYRCPLYVYFKRFVEIQLLMLKNGDLKIWFSQVFLAFFLHQAKDAKVHTLVNTQISNLHLLKRKIY